MLVNLRPDPQTNPAVPLVITDRLSHLDHAGPQGRERVIGRNRLLCNAKIRRNNEVRDKRVCDVTSAFEKR